MRTLCICGLLSLASIAQAQAETAYVTDILQLGLHAAQDTSDRPFRTLVSGAELEIIQRVPNYAQVRTEDGREGWVKSAFLVDDKPAQLIVAETQAAMTLLQQDLAGEREARAAAQAELDRIVNDAESKLGRAISMEAEIKRLDARNRELEGQLDAYRTVVPFSWAVTAGFASLLGGFFLGLWTLDAYVRRRHGGFRVY